MDNPRNILIIPHQPHRTIRVRALEMARQLAGSGHRVHVLTWTPSRVVTANPLVRILAKGAEALQSATTRPQVEADAATPNLYWITMPFLLAPNGICQRFNGHSIKTLLTRHAFDVVINASAYHFPVSQSSALYIYDVVDDHLSEGAGPHWQTTRAFTLRECAKADHVAVISHSLQEMMREHGFSSPVLLPNGVDYITCASVTPEALQALKQKHGLRGDEFVLAYIGNHGPWSGLDFLLKAFQKVSDQLPDARLIIVGPGVEVDRHSRHNANPHVVFTGPVSPEEATAYFHLTHMGLLPFDRMPFTDHALPLKIFEYGAAHKRVLSSPLKELNYLGLPHVQLLPLEVDAWASALIAEARQPLPWQMAWDETLKAYDWQQVLAPLHGLIGKKMQRAPG